MSENSVKIGRSITDDPEIKTNNGIRNKKISLQKDKRCRLNANRLLKCKQRIMSF